jgi:hypothetical protein
MICRYNKNGNCKKAKHTPCDWLVETKKCPLRDPDEFESWRIDAETAHERCRKRLDEPERILT